MGQDWTVLTRGAATTTASEGAAPCHLTLPLMVCSLVLDVHAWSAALQHGCQQIVLRRILPFVAVLVLQCHAEMPGTCSALQTSLCCYPHLQIELSPVSLNLPVSFHTHTSQQAVAGNPKMPKATHQGECWQSCFNFTGPDGELHGSPLMSHNQAKVRK